MKVGIIGAGAAGLAAAYTLGKAGHQATVYEGAPFLGGQASTFDVGGGRLERGYHHLFTSDTDIVDLIHELGLGEKMAWIESKVGIFYGDKIYDFVTPADLLRFTPLNILDRVRLGLVTLYLRKYKDWRKLEPFVASDWIRKYAGKGVYDVVWGPLLRGKFGAHFDKVGMPWFWGKIQTRFASRGKGLKGMQRERLGYPLGSFAEVFEVLAERITEMGGEVHLSTPVRSIAVEDGRAVGLEVPNAEGDGAVRPFDAVLATTPSYIFPRLVPSLPQDYLDRLQERHVPVRGAGHTGSQGASVARLLAEHRRPLHPVCGPHRTDQLRGPLHVRRQAHPVHLQLPGGGQPPVPHVGAGASGRVHAPPEEDQPPLRSLLD